MRSPRFTLVLLALMAALARAQTPISGPISDGAGGPLLSGVVYHATSSLSVPAGTTLTVQPGAIVKFSVSGELSVSGDLVVAGTAGQPVIFTDLSDDTAGGDTNGDGASTGTPGHWRGLRFASATATGDVDHLDLRFGGRIGYAGIEISGSAVSLDDCSVSSCTAAALDLNNVIGPVTVTSCDFTSNLAAVTGVPFSLVPGFVNNTASGNTSHDTLNVVSGAVSGATSITTQNMISGVIRLNSSVSVSTGAMLDVGPGCILKWAVTSAQLAVSGTLTCSGTAGSPVIFTDVADDSAGGDTDKNGATTGTPGHWRGLSFDAGSGASALTHTEVRYSGQLGYAGIEIIGEPVTLTDCTVSDGLSAGLDMNNIAADVTVASCDFTGNDRPIEGVQLVSLPGFTNNTASGNVDHDSLSVAGAAVATGTTSITTANMVSGVVVLTQSITVASGATLVVDAGCIFKWSTVSTYVGVSGTLTCNGSGGSPIIFTLFSDDAHGGDTNNDGSASVSVPGAWRGLQFDAGSDASVITNTEIWYGGRIGYASVEIVNSAVTLDDCAIRNGLSAGLDMNNIVADVSVTGCDVTGCDRAYDAIPLVSLPGFAGNTASGNTAHNSLKLAAATLSSGTTTITDQNMVSGAVMASQSITVNAGATLTFESGTVIKWSTVSTQVQVAGTLNCNGTPGAPVVFTEIADDAWGGDTDLTAATPAPAYWRGIFFNAGSAASTLSNTLIRFAGRLSYPGVTIVDDITMVDCTVDAAFADGISLSNSAAQPILEDCTVSNCGSVAIDALRWGSLRYFANNQLIANGSNYARIESGAIGADDVIRRAACPGGVIVMAASPSLVVGDSLTIEEGVIVKVAFNMSFSVSGRFEVLGTGPRPVVFTSLEDDDFGGDTNGDGAATSPTSAWWRGIDVTSAALPSTLDHLVLRYTGRLGYPGFNIDNDTVAVNALRIDASSADGAVITALDGDAENWIVHDCGSEGIRLLGDDLQLIHATVADCGGYGIQATASWTGTIVNSISWNNGLGNYDGLAPGVLSYSNGSMTEAGTNGNIDADPLFVDAAQGDLELLPASPCKNTADTVVADALREDHREGSRSADGDLSGVVLADMGALETMTWHLTVDGHARLGETQSFGLAGPAGIGAIMLAGTTGNQRYYADYGWLLIGNENQIVLVGFTIPGFPLPVTFPDIPALSGFPFQVQGVCVLGTDTTRGNFTERYRANIAP